MDQWVAGGGVEQWKQEINTMDVEALARATGFQQRTQRKVRLPDFVGGLLAVAAAGHQSLERVAASIARCARVKYSKQALDKRLGTAAVGFLAAVFVRCFRPALREASDRGLFTAFTRVLLHDSTSLALPKRYAADYPGCTNQHGSSSQLKIQLVCNLLDSTVAQVALSGYTRNDQSAAVDILEELRPGDLLIRDLGYFTLSVFRQIAQRSACFLSRYRHDVTVLDPATHRPIPLAKVLGKQGFFDAWVLLGVQEQLPVRLVAQPVPEAVANARRRTLRQGHDRKLNPSKEHFFLLGWNIYITNVAEEVWSAATFPPLYRLRWRIETLFKAFKSHLALTLLSHQSLKMIRLSVMTRLIFCAFVYRTCHHLELSGAQRGRHASILRVANLLSGLALCLEAAWVGLTPQALLAQLLEQHAFYEQRKDRKNFQELLAACLTA
jgi:hypothetical protein